MRIGIIGSGIGGLGLAALLAKDGHQVTVLEKNSQLGGRCNVFEAKGFRFDMGPSWYLMPDVFASFYQKLDRDINKILDLRPLHPSYTVFYDDGEQIAVSTDVDAMAGLFEQWEPGAGEKFRTFLQQSGYAYQVAMEDFVYKNYRSPLDFLNKRILTEGRKLHVFESMDRHVKRSFRDPRIHKILEYTLVFLGGAPSNTPAIYSIMTHVDFAMGVWYPMGGMYTIPQSLVEIGSSFGVTYRKDTPVTRIQSSGTQVTGVTCADGTTLELDAVISNADYHFTETLLGNHRQYSQRYWNKRTVAPSAYILYLGVNQRIPALSHHNLLFAGDWQEHFEEIFDRPAWPKDPSIYIGCPSKTDPHVAPEGCENLFVLVPIAPGLDDTPEIRIRFEETVFRLLEQQLGMDLRPYLLYKRAFTINDFTEQYHAFRGSALGLAHTLFQTAAFRPKNTHKHLQNMWYVGADTTPGIGVPMCLISAELTHNLVSAYAHKHPHL